MVKIINPEFSIYILKKKKEEKKYGTYYIGMKFNWLELLLIKCCKMKALKGVFTVCPSLIQYNLSNPACYQTEKKIRIRQGAGIERSTYPRDIKVTLVSIGIQHTADNGYVNELYIVHTNLFQVKTFEVIISYPQIKPLKIKFLCL